MRDRIRITIRCCRPTALMISLVFASFCCQSHAGQEMEPSYPALRSAIEHLSSQFGDRYPNSGDYLSRLEQLEGNHAEIAEVASSFAKLKREALQANPLVTEHPILFVVRKQFRKDHHNSATMFQTGEINTSSFDGGGSLKIIQFGNGGKVTTRLDVPRGVIRDPDVSFDGNRIVFALRDSPEDDYHIYELRNDESTPRQLTRGAGLSDIDPVYLPNGQIAFTSTREPKYCMCNRHIMGNLFLMEGDGTGIRQIGHSTLHEGHATVLPDGRLLYDRWEYVDRNFGDAQGVWTVNPDGTNHSVYYGNNMNSPGAVLDARAISGTDQFIATFSSCHDRPWGAIALVDRRLGVDGKASVRCTWPASAMSLVGKGNYDTFCQVRQKFEDPYPLSDSFFLASGMTGNGEQMGLWLLDRFGNELLLHDEVPGCYDPMPLAARKRPPVVPSRVDPSSQAGNFFIADVYVGTGMESIKRGTIKRVRVVESPEKRFWTNSYWNGSGTQAPAMAWDDFNNKRILGSAPVEEDGSAYFTVPANRFVYFQLLDENDMMVQSMRSGTTVRPGETTGCVGCHENRRGTFAQSHLPEAMTRAASDLQPWNGPPRLFNYPTEVQPVFDEHCVQCHDYQHEAGRKLNLAGDLGLVFNTSYIELRSKGYVEVVGAGPYTTQQPKTWGSHASRLAKVLIEGHGDPEIDDQIKVDEASRDRVMTWIDINAPYYPRYASAYREHPFGRSPLNVKQLEHLGKLTGLDLRDQKNVAMVNFTRPANSLCLAGLGSMENQKYRDAFDIIEAGKRTLEQRPRADMAGFSLVDPIEIRQQQKYLDHMKELSP